MAFFTAEIEVGSPATKIGHGFAVGQAIKADGGDYALARANTGTNCNTVLGVVTDVYGPDQFRYGLPGEVVGQPGDYGAGSVYYLSELTAGGLTIAPPSASAVYLVVGQATPEGRLLLGGYLGLEGVQQTGAVVQPPNVYEITTATPHGFLAGDAIRSTASGYAKAQADTGPNSDAYIGVVASVGSATDFSLALPGARYGSGFTGGTVYYLSEVTAGALTTSQPASPGFVVPAGVGLPDGSLLILQYIGVPA